MSSLVHAEYSKQHNAAERFEHVLSAASSLRKGFDCTRGLAGGLLAAMVSALVVVVSQLMESLAEGHLLAAWVLLWAVGFSAMALLAPATRALADRVMRVLDSWSRGVARRRADARLWDLARKDPRVMADLQAARSRDGS
jgi:hypothetical protein